jgi:hypothetical protein
MDPSHSQSGRVKRPTERFLTYVNESMSSSKKNKKTRVDATTTSTHAGNDEDSKGINVSTYSNHEGGISRLCTPSSISTKKKNMKSYSCSHCGYLTASKSPQDFIKSHHFMEQNRDCYNQGLIHCPNPDCKKVFLSHKDMERHCTMKGLKDTCLKFYRKLKAIEFSRTTHNSTQVDIPEVSRNTLNIYGQNHILQVGTLYNTEPFFLSSNDLNTNWKREDVIDNLLSPSTNYSAHVISQSHDHNVLVVQGEYLSGLAPMSYSKQLEVMHGKGQADVSDENIDQSQFNLDDEHTDLDEIHVEAPVEAMNDLSLVLIDMKRSMDTAHMTRHFTREQKACISLEQILRKANAPLYLYDEIMTWVYKNKGKIYSIEPIINRKSLYDTLGRKIYGKLSNEMKPKEIPMTLPSGRRCGVTVFNIHSQILSLLTRKDINQWDNYFFSPTDDDQFHLNTFSDWDTGFFNDIETSIWYKRTQEQVVTDPENEILVPICLFIDSTVLSLSGSLSIEPIMFSLMLHNRETRQKPEAWLPIGYINDVSSIVGKKYKNGKEKLADYHAMLNQILQEFTELVTSPTGITWMFNNVPGGNNIVTKKLIFRLAFIIGDTKGHDMLCCRMGSHNWTQGLCRDCDMVTEHADDPSVPCSFLKQKDLALKSEEELKAMSFYRVDPYPFDKLPFGASPYGVNGATAIDIIHAVLLGLMEYLDQTFTDQLTDNQLQELSKYIAFIATYHSKAIPGFPDTRRFKKGLKVKGILTAKMRLARCFLVFLALSTKGFQLFLRNQTGKLPSTVQKKMRELRKARQQDESITSTSSDDSSTQSCSSSQQSSGDEDEHISEDDEDDNESEDSSAVYSDCDEQGLYFDQADDAVNEDDDSTYDPFKDFESREAITFTDEVINDWRDLFERTLMFYGWLKSTNMPCFLFKYGSKSVAKHCTERFMQLYRLTAHRFDGMGLKLTKFHQIRHWFFYITMYGVPTNFDSSFCESHHIHHTKKKGRRTQKRQDQLASQTAQRVYESSLLDASIDAMKDGADAVDFTEGVQNNDVSGKMRGARFTITFDYSAIDDRNLDRALCEIFEERPVTKFSWDKKRNRKHRSFPKYLLEAIGNKIAWFNNGNSCQRISSIRGCTEIHFIERKGEPIRHIIRSHPDYRKKGVWMDWVEIAWENEEDQANPTALPAQVLMFLDYDEALYEPIPIHILNALVPDTFNGNLRSNYQHQSRNGIHVVIHSAKEPNNFHDDVEQTQISICRRFQMEPFYQIVSVDNLCGIAFVARDPPTCQNVNHNDQSYEITLVMHPAEWQMTFIPVLCKDYTRPDEDEILQDEFNDEVNPW